MKIPYDTIELINVLNSLFMQLDSRNQIQIRTYDSIAKRKTENIINPET